MATKTYRVQINKLRADNEHIHGACIIMKGEKQPKYYDATLTIDIPRDITISEDKLREYFGKSWLEPSKAGVDNFIKRCFND